ncbi:MAG: hypothetical protein M5U19_16860 [Microthrixaceae bacterium]|nr:hypothetical protein [Microthrixaceae bacterium]
MGTWLGRVVKGSCPPGNRLSSDEGRWRRQLGLPEKRWIQLDAPPLGHIPSFDGFRGVFILVVVLYHAEVLGFLRGWADTHRLVLRLQRIPHHKPPAG